MRSWGEAFLKSIVLTIAVFSVLIVIVATGMLVGHFYGELAGMATSITIFFVMVMTLFFKE